MKKPRQIADTYIITTLSYDDYLMTTKMED